MRRRDIAWRCGAALLALSLVFAATPLQAQADVRRTRESVEALRGAAGVLESGDVTATVALLASMRQTVGALQRAFERERKNADVAMARNLDELKSLTQKAAEAYQSTLGHEAQSRARSAEYEALQGRMIALNTRRVELDKQLTEFLSKRRVRIWCNQQFAWGMFDGKCVNSDVAADITGKGIDGAIEDATLQLKRVDEEFWPARSRLEALNAETRQDNADILRLQDLIAQLKLQEGMRRDFIVQLRRATSFLADLQTILDYRLDYPLAAFQRRVRVLIADAKRTGTPVALDEDLGPTEPLRQTLNALAALLDEQGDLLAALESGALTCPPSPRENERTMAASLRVTHNDWTRFQGAGDVIGAARCHSLAAFYFGKVVSAEDCEFHCKMDSECAMWTWEEKPDAGQCWGASTALTPNWKMEMVKTLRSGGLKTIRQY